MLEPVVDEASAWTLFLALKARIADRGPLVEVSGWRLEHDRWVEVAPEHAAIVLGDDEEAGWTWGPAGGEPPSSATRQILDLYLPLCLGPGRDRFVVAHLAQSLDGRVATSCGRSQFISGQEDLVHTHRLRALFDAVLVGASTVEHDDPRLTTRLAEGDNAVRVIVDPRGRLACHHRVFADRHPPTLLLRGRGVPGPQMPAGTTVIELETRQGRFEVPTLVEALAQRGLRRLFVEGGGVTVSAFLRAGVLDRLHVAVAPLVIGSGRASFTLPDIEDLDAALRLPCRHFALGADVLFDCPVTRPDPVPAAAGR